MRSNRTEVAPMAEQKNPGFGEDQPGFRYDSPQFPSPPISATIGEGGRLVIPAEMRKAMGITPGDTVSLRLEEGALRVVSPKMAREAVQKFALKWKKHGTSEVDEFLAERREEARRVDERFDRLEREAAEIGARKRNG